MTYIVLGTTDEVTQCERCGKPELRGTVVLGELDEDGNVEGVAYFGSTCAARALGRSGRGVGAQVRSEADAAALAARQGAEMAREFFGYYGPDPLAEASVWRFIDAHKNAMWAAGTTWAGWVALVAKSAQRHTDALVAAARLGI